MRTCLSILFALALVSCGNRGNSGAAQNDGILHVVELSRAVVVSPLARDTVRLGTLHEGEVTQYRIELRNTDTEPLVILEAKGSCGCTEIDYPRSPIRPGETAELTLRYDSRGQAGFQFKTVRLFTSLDPKPYPLLLTAEVVE